MRSAAEVSRLTYALLALTATVKAVSLIMIAGALAAGVTAVIGGTSALDSIMMWGLTGVALRAASAWAARVIAARAALGMKERLRSELARKLVSSAGESPAGDTVLATRGLDELDKYFSVYMPSLVTACVVPLALGARILLADWVSAVVIAVTIPLVPLFMILIGLHTQDRIAAASRALERLADHMVELARGLPVLVGLGRADEQRRALHAISEDSRAKTMATLRTAFLSSLVLELIATISVAVVAVFIGVRLVSGSLTLEVGLIALLLAPDCFAPFRELGSAFHAAQEGRHALERAGGILERDSGRRFVEEEPGEASGVPSVRVTALRVHYGGRTAGGIGPVTFTAGPAGLTLLDGPSGAGKSTVLAVLADSIRDDEEQIAITGHVSGFAADDVAWLPQHPKFSNTTVRAELLAYAGDHPVDESVITELCGRLGVHHLLPEDPGELSPGEQRRIAFARTVVRVECGARFILLDEPTAHLDAAAAASVRHELVRLAKFATVIVASHDPAVRRLASTTIALDGLARAEVSDEEVPSGDLAVREPRQLARDAGASESAPFRALLSYLHPVAARVLGAIVLAFLSAGFAVALTALSAWLIVRASEQPPIMVLLVAIVGVRFFGIGRSVLRYAQRLVEHDAVFAATTALRDRLWLGFAGRGVAQRALLTSARTFDVLVAGTEQLRDLTIRAVTPFTSGLLVALGFAVTVGVLAPGALPMSGGMLLVCLIVAPASALLSDRRAAKAEQRLRSLVASEFSAMLHAADDLRVNGVESGMLARISRLDTAATAHARRGAWSLGLGSALVVAACGTTAFLLLPFSDGADSIAGTTVAVLALLPLAMIDPMLDLLASMQLWPSLRRAAGKVAPFMGAVDESKGSTVSTAQSPPHMAVESLAFDGVAVRWPGAANDLLSDISLEITRGDWLVITGPSGSGKSTLVSVLLGHLQPSAGSYLLDGVDTTLLSQRALSERITWAPQEGHLFNSTLRGNLLIARPREAAPDDAEMIRTLVDAGLSGLIERLPNGLDTAIGPSGTRLSGGERQRLAVARSLLRGSDIVILDEPTAHLDSETSNALMGDLRRILHDRIVVVVTHDTSVMAEGDRRLDLSELRSLATEMNVGAAA